VLRSARKLTQEMVAERADLTQKYVSELERGRRSPSWETLMAIAHQGFKIKLAGLMFGVDEDIAAEVQDLSDVLAGWPAEVRRDLLRGVELLLRAVEAYCRARREDLEVAATGGGSGRSATAVDAARAKRRVAAKLAATPVP